MRLVGMIVSLAALAGLFLVATPSPLALFAEEYDVETGRHLGNFPQAFSHLALVEAAARIIVAEGLQELAG